MIVVPVGLPPELHQCAPEYFLSRRFRSYSACNLDLFGACTPDADILREIDCLLTQRVRAGRAVLLLKVKSHRGEPINERADTLAEEGRDNFDENKRWDDRTDRMTFTLQKGNTTVRSVWKLQEVRATEAKHWTERVWYCHNQRWMRSSKEGTEVSRSGSFKNGQE